MVDRAGILHLVALSGPSDPEAADGGDARKAEIAIGSVRDTAPRVLRMDYPLPSLLDRREQNPREFWRFLTVLQPNPQGFAILGATYDGTFSLVLQSRWGSRARVISQLGGSVIGVDSDYEGLAYSQLSGSGERQHFARILTHLPLPFQPDTFDNVFLDGIPAMGAAGAPRPYRERQRRLLLECARVLKPGGRIIISAPNRFSLWSPDRPARSQLGGSAANQENSRGTGDGHRGFRAELLGRAGYSRLLERSGFIVPRFALPWPNGSNWSRIQMGSAGSAIPFVDNSSGSWKQRARTALFAVATRLHLEQYLFPTFLIVAHTPHAGADTSSPARKSSLELIAEEMEVPTEDVREIISLSNSQSLTFSTDRRFIKIPLTSRAEASLRAEADALQQLNHQEWSRGIGLQDVRVHEVSGLAFVSYPRVDGTRDGSLEEKAARLIFALDRLALDTRVLPLRQTDCWARITSEEMRSELEELGAGTALEMLHEWSDRRVPVGMVHGDLSWGNLLVDGDGHTVVIDWDRFEAVAPKLLDTVHACHSLARTYHFLGSGRRSNQPLSRIGWELMIRRDPNVPLLERIDQTRGELAFKEALGLTLLNKICRSISASRESFAVRLAQESNLRDHIGILQGCLGHA